MAKVDLDFQTISSRIRELDFPKVDVVVGIATGGIIPAIMIAFHLQKELEIVQFNYRDKDNTPQYETPKMLRELSRDISGKRVLIVDDVSVSGKTLKAAGKLFADSTLITCVMKGKADISAFPEIRACVNWPWKI